MIQPGWEKPLSALNPFLRFSLIHRKTTNCDQTKLHLRTYLQRRMTEQPAIREGVFSFHPLAEEIAMTLILGNVLRLSRQALAGSLLALTVAAVGTITPHGANAQTLTISSSALPSAELVGTGTMRFLGFRVFDAELFAPNGRYDPNRPFALKLTYLRNFEGQAIADKSAEEIQRQGVGDSRKLNRWKSQMAAIFPDVRKGQSITGLRDASGNTVFYSGKRRIGAIRDREFTRYFFNIWLGPNTRDAGLRNRLVGQGS